MCLKVIIVGGNSKEKYFIPKKGYEIWGLNAIRFEWINKFDRMFNLHMYKHLKRDWKKGIKKEIEWANSNKKIPFYVCDKWKSIPHATIFPRNKMKFGSYNYHCGSFDWLVAYAIYLGAEEIEIHGVELTLEAGEPISAQACLMYWIGYAEAKNIKITVAKDADLFSNYALVKTNKVYGYDDVFLKEDISKKKITIKGYKDK